PETETKVSLIPGDRVKPVDLGRNSRRLACSIQIMQTCVSLSSVYSFDKRASGMEWRLVPVRRNIVETRQTVHIPCRRNVEVETIHEENFNHLKTRMRLQDRHQQRQVLHRQGLQQSQADRSA